MLSNWSWRVFSLYLSSWTKFVFIIMLISSYNWLKYTFCTEFDSRHERVLEGSESGPQVLFPRFAKLSQEWKVRVDFLACSGRVWRPARPLRPNHLPNLETSLRCRYPERRDYYQVEFESARGPPRFGNRSCLCKFLFTSYH